MHKKGVPLKAGATGKSGAKFEKNAPSSPLPSTKPGAGKKMPVPKSAAKGAASDQKAPAVAKRARKAVVGNQPGSGARDKRLAGMKL